VKWVSAEKSNVTMARFCSFTASTMAGSSDKLDGDIFRNLKDKKKYFILLVYVRLGYISGTLNK